MIPIFRKGYGKELDFFDLHKYCEADSPEVVADRLEKNWNIELKTKRNPSVVRALARAFGLRYLVYACICLITVSILTHEKNAAKHHYLCRQECVAKTFQPLLIGLVVNSFSKSGFDNEAARKTAYLAAAGICLSSVFETFGRNHYQLLVRRVALNCRSSLTILVYKKILRLSMSSFDNTSVGQVLNILANDFNRFDELGHVLIYILIAPIQSAIVMCIMWIYTDLSFACVGGMVILFMFIPFQGLMGRLFNRFR
jgi:ATP-binding cassette subfamily C (CFTR/MRP) protein 4